MSTTTSAQTLPDFEIDADSIDVATGDREPRAISSIIATVVTADEIERYGYRSVLEALENTPGLHIGRNSSLDIPILSSRGLVSGSSFRILLNGQPATARSYSSNELAAVRVPMSMIERIEILRGPGSSDYDIESFLGTINVVTGAGRQGASLTAGSYSTLDGTLVQDAGIGQYAGTIGLEVSRTDGDRPPIEADIQTLIDAELGTDASLAPGRARYGESLASITGTFVGPSSQWNLTLSAFEDKEAGVGQLPVLDPTGETDLLQLASSFQQTLFETEDWSVDGRLALEIADWDNDDYQWHPPGAFGLFPDGVRGQIRHQEQFGVARVRSRYRGLARHEVSLSVELQQSHVRVQESNGNYSVDPVSGALVPGNEFGLPEAQYERSSIELRLNDQVQVTNSILTSFGANVENPEGQPTEISPRASVSIQTGPDTNVALLVGQSVRYPAALESLTVAPAALQGTDDVEPERMTSYDLSIEHALSRRMRLRGNLFRNEIDDSIAYVADPATGVIRATNGRGRLAEGVEFELAYEPYPVYELALFGHYLTRARTQRMDGDWVDAGWHPRRKLGLRGSYRAGRWTASLSTTHTGDRLRAYDSVLADRPENYTLVDVSTRYRLTRAIDLELKVENLLDDVVVEQNLTSEAPFDLELPGRAVFVQLSARW